MQDNYWEDFFNNVHYSWMENWYHKLKEYTIPSAYMRINIDEVKALINLVDNSKNAVKLVNFEDRFLNIKNNINGYEFFVRLGSRSPKDAFSFKGINKKVKDIDNIYTLFVNSDRIIEDLMLCKMVGYEPYLFLREWIDIPKSREFRCFVKDRKLVGISQYFYRDRFYYLDDEETRNRIKRQADYLLSRIYNKYKHDNFVFDIVYEPDKHLPLLIEINPYSSWTDPCMFDWAVDKFEEFEFKWLKDIDKPDKLQYI